MYQDGHMPPLLQALIATLLVSAVSLVGVVFIFAEWSERLEVLFLSFAAGILLGTTFLELLPEAVEVNADGNVFLATLAAIVVFFLLERYLHGFHGHEEGHAKQSRYLILVGDSVHNFADGVAIAASFLVSPSVGVATTLAVAAHEIPQEIADYGVLVSGGFSRRKALLLNFYSGLTALLGAVGCFVFGDFVTPHLGYFMAASAGMFVYIAAADLMPELHHSRWRNSWLCTVPFFAGIALMGVLLVAIPESH
jgi:zinc and cadmium transporter